MKIIKNKKGIGINFLITLAVCAILAIMLIPALTNAVGVSLGALDAFTGGCSLRNPQTPEEVAACPTNTIVCQARNNYKTSGSFKEILASVCCCKLDAVVDKSDPPAYLTDFNEYEGSMDNKDGIPDEEMGDVFCRAGEVICGAQNADEASYDYDDAKDALSNLKCCPAKGIYVFRWDAEDVRILRDASDPGEVSACDVDEVVCAAKHLEGEIGLLKYIWCCKYDEFEPRVDGTVTWEQGDTYDFDAGGYHCKEHEKLWCVSGEVGELWFSSSEEDESGNLFHRLAPWDGVGVFNAKEDGDVICSDQDSQDYIDYPGLARVYSEDYVCIKTRTGKYVLMHYKEIISDTEGKFSWEFQ